MYTGYVHVAQGHNYGWGGVLGVATPWY